MNFSRLNPINWGITRSAAWRIVTKASQTSELFTTVGTVYGQGAMRPQDYKNYAEQTYVKNVIAYRSILTIAQSVASVRWKVFRRNSDGSREEIQKHAIIDLKRRPNPNESWAFIMLQTTAYMALAGNAYWEKVAPLTGRNAGIPKELYVLRPDRVKVLVNRATGVLDGFRFELNGRKKEFMVDQITLQGDVYQFRNFHPLNDWYGLSDTEPTAREIDTANMGVDYNMRMFQNEGRPGMVLEYPSKIGTQEFTLLEAKLKQKYSGPQNAGKNIILTEGGKAHPYAFKPKEMDYIKAHESLARRVAIGYGVFPMLLGIPGEATFANFKEARQAFWEQTVFYYLNYLRDEMNIWFFAKEPDLFLDYILDDLPALEPKREMLWKRANDANFITINEKRELVGMEAVDDGDVVLVPATMAPLGFEEEELEPGEGE